MVLYAGKSVTSSGEGYLVVGLGFRRIGGGISGSRRCASPSMSTVEILLYLAALAKIELII